MSEVKIHSLVGAAEERRWSQAQSIHKTEFAVTLVLRLERGEGEDVLDLASVGGAVFEKFHEQGESLKTQGEWGTWIKSEIAELKNTGINCKVIMGYIREQNLWVWGEGAVEVILFREGKIARIGSGEGEGMEGKVSEGDVVVLGTEGAVGGAVKEPMRETLLTKQNLEEDLAPSFYADGEVVAEAMIVLEVKGETKVDEKVVPKFAFPKITIKRMREEPRRFNLLVGGGVVAILILLVGVGILRRNARVADGAYRAAVGRAETMLTEAESVAGSNPERAKILLSQSAEVIESYIKSEPKNEYLRKAKEQQARIEMKESEILRVRGSELRPTIELAVLSEGLTADKIQEDKDFLYFWDERTRGFVGVSVKDLSKVSYLVENERSIRPFVVADGEYVGIASGGVWRARGSEQKIVIPTDEEWGTITQVATFGNNIYLLDTGMGEIWKYAATDNGYAERRRWFGAGIVLDLSKVVDWVVDGDVWLLTASGKLERYSRGVPVNFSLTGFPSASEKGGFVEPVAVAVSEGVAYVLERGAGRVVAIKDDGTYLEQYVASEFARASDLVIAEGKGYVLVDNVIKEWEL